jgi:hypothetical protein
MTPFSARERAFAIAVGTFLAFGLWAFLAIAITAVG